MQKLIKLGVGLLAVAPLISTSAFALVVYPTVEPTISPAAGALVTVFGLLYCGCYLLLCLAILAVYVFNIVMLIDVAGRTEAQVPAKTAYLILLIIGLLFWPIGIISSLVYYFSVKRPLGKAPAAV